MPHTIPLPMQGLLFAAISALSLSVLTTAAVFAYNGGSEPFTLVAIRASAGFLIACLLIHASHQQIRFPRGSVALVLAFSIGQLMINYGYMTSVLYIPISLAALIFYIFPVLVLFAEATLARRLPKPLEIASFATAFLGLTLVLGPSLETLNWLGVTTALIAAVGGVLVMTTGSRAAQRLGAVSTLFHMQLIACLVTLTVMLCFGGPVLPKIELGWWGLGVACFGYSLGIVTQIFAVKLVDPASASLVYNLEPLATLGIAAWVLTERLSSFQYIGSALILAAILLAGRLASKPPP